MRHIIRTTGSITLLSQGVLDAPTLTGLIALAYCALAQFAHGKPAVFGAVAIATITVRADQYLFAAANPAEFDAAEFQYLIRNVNEQGLLLSAWP